MNGSWSALRAQFVQQSQTLKFFLNFRDLRLGNRALEPFPDPLSLLEYLRGSAGTLASKNRVLHALLTGRQRDTEVAGVLLTLALWPALDRAYRDLCRGFSGDPEAVGHELIGASTETMLRADPRKVTTVAATLVRNAKRDATLALRTHKTFASWLDPDIETRVAAAGDPDDVQQFPTCEDDGTWLRARLEQDFGQDAGIVFDVAVNDISQRDVAERIGVSYEAVRKRHQRTTERIRRNRPEYLSPRVPIRTPGWHLSSEGTGEAGVRKDDADDGVRGTARTAPGAVSPVGTPRDPADGRRVPDRARGGDDGRRDPRRRVPPDR